MNSPIIETRAADDSRERLQRLSAIAGQLLDGILVAEHIVDRAALEHALATDVLRDEQTFGRVLDILEAENWARSWTD